MAQKLKTREKVFVFQYSFPFIKCTDNYELHWTEMVNGIWLQIKITCLYSGTWLHKKAPLALVIFFMCFCLAWPAFPETSACEMFEEEHLRTCPPLAWTLEATADETLSRKSADELTCYDWAKCANVLFATYLSSLLTQAFCRSSNSSKNLSFASFRQPP